MNLYQPIGAALELWYSQVPEILLEGPAGTGKSRSILEKIYLLCWRYPGIRVLVCRRTRTSMTESVLVTWEDEVVPSGHPVLLGAKRQRRQRYIFSNGSTVVVGGLDDPGSIFSTQYDIIYIAEATQVSLGSKEDISTRLRNGKMPYDQLIMDCNPGPPAHWLNQGALRGEIPRLHSRHEDNPVLYDRDESKWTDAGDRYIARLNRLTGARKKRLRFGLWAQQEGMVYEDWDPLVHVVDRRTLPEGTRKIGVIDFGYINPLCVLWGGVVDDQIIIYREFYKTHQLVRKLAPWLREVQVEENVECYVCDHDAEAQADLRSHNCITIPAYKDIERGIQAVEERLKLRGDGKPGLVYMADSLLEVDPILKEDNQPVSTLEEIEMYAYPLGIDGKPRKDIPIDMYNHGMDCIRYLVCYVDQIGTKVSGISIL